MKNRIRIIGDVHGKWRQYLKLLDTCTHSIQIGDLGFAYDVYNELDKTKHFAFRGNHDNYDVPLPIDLGEYGMRTVGSLNFFFVRGAFSLDWQQRLQHEHENHEKCWWPQEELSMQELHKTVKAYEKAKPSIVITHDAPRNIGKLIGNPRFLRSFGYNPETFNTRTSEALEFMFKIWEPKYWYHGHFHHSHKTKLGKTTFVGLRELEYIDVDKDGKSSDC
jgi:hypothetical protein